jgi:hypothetical protein
MEIQALHCRRVMCKAKVHFVCADAFRSEIPDATLLHSIWTTYVPHCKENLNLFEI